jgi:hypothetical protein
MKRMNCDSVLIGPRSIELAGGLPLWKRVLDIAIILLFSPVAILTTIGHRLLSGRFWRPGDQVHPSSAGSEKPQLR